MALWPKLPRFSSSEPVREKRPDLMVALDRCYRRPLINYFEKRIREAYDIEDLVQEVFVRLSHRQTLQDIDFMEGYVFQTAANVMKDRARQRVVRKASSHDPLDNCELPTNDFSPERVLQGRQQIERVIGALGELPERTQQIFLLRLYDGLKQEDIAVRFGISVEGVRFHLRRAKAHIVRSLEQGA